MYGSADTLTFSADRTRFHQDCPSRYCQDRGNPFRRGKCRDPRRSLQCRCNYAHKEAEILAWFLEQMNLTALIYFGMLAVRGEITEHEHRQFRKAFLHQLRDFGLRRQSVVKFLAVSEIGKDFRVHYHYAVYSTGPISHDDIRGMWASACDGRGTIIDHDPPQKCVRAGAKYMFKDLLDVCQGRQVVQLFEKKTLPITWGSRGFYAPYKKDEIWRTVIREWTGDAFEDWRSSPSHLLEKRPRPAWRVIRMAGVPQCSRGGRNRIREVAVNTSYCPRPPPSLPKVYGNGICLNPRASSNGRSICIPGVLVFPNA